MKILKDKKEKINSIIDRIKSQGDQLKQTLDRVYTEAHALEDEKEFVAICNSIQRSVKEAVAETGYYKDLATGYRAQYAPEELEGDVSEFADAVKAQFHDIEYPKVNRVYRIDPYAQNMFDVALETVENPTCAITRTHPHENQEYTKEFWEETTRLYRDIDPTWKFIFDEDVIAAAKNFMVGPVTLWRSKPIVAETQRFPSFEALKESILKQAQDKDMVLYMTYETTHKTLGPAPDYEVVNETPMFIWRGAFLDKE
jgi:hypothetical protein